MEKVYQVGHKNWDAIFEVEKYFLAQNISY